MGWTIKWVENWLYFHVQTVMINSSTCGWHPVTSKVPQGQYWALYFSTSSLTTWTMTQISLSANLQTTLNLERLADTMNGAALVQRHFEKLENWANEKVVKLIKEKFCAQVNNTMHQCKLGYDCPARCWMLSYFTVDTINMSRQPGLPQVRHISLQCATPQYG